jgi:hypothetical protein
MTLTQKERLQRAVRHQPIDCMPTQINYTAKWARNWPRISTCPPLNCPRCYCAMG